jgi:(p)ppGpp synthase/HD superfamily hydrolase
MRELENRQQLQKWLGEVREQVAREEVTEWCGRLADIADELERAAEGRESAVAEITTAGGKAPDIAELERELAQIEREAAESIAAGAGIAARKARAEVEWFAQLQRNARYARWIGGNSAVREQEVETFNAHYLCAVCGERVCGCVLNKCAHPMCRECAEAAMGGGACPICRTPLKQNHIIRFFYKP